ncbi:MAG TPA: hypothetical protein VNF68_02775 [Candidatus Baltobacteraceae bacterium]|nr:hypothetical protein [Candidatus Dormibacteraeota bacterium]HVA27074.1 hypothetical protein [Candidatus Baltobacteraceae bacterium]
MQAAAHLQSPAGSAGVRKSIAAAKDWRARPWQPRKLARDWRLALDFTLTSERV